MMSYRAHSLHQLILCGLAISCFGATYFGIAGFGTGVALAQEEQTKEQQAQSFYNQAVTLFSQGRHREAIVAFDKAIAINPVPIYYCNKAIAQIKQDQFNDAIKSMTTCRDTFKGDKAELAKIDARLKAIEVVTAHARTTGPLTAQSIALKSKIVKPPPAKIVTPVDTGWDASDFGYISVAAGGALLASAVTLDWLSADTVDRFKKESSSGDKDAYDEARATIEQRQSIFWGLTIGGSVLTALGIGLITYQALGTSDTPATTSTIAPVFGPREVGVRWHLSF